jgi:hypothetical protein
MRKVSATLVVLWGLSRKVTCGDARNYSIPDLPIGIYKIEAAKKGFKTIVSTQVKLDIQRTSVGTLIENQQIVDLPIDGRDYLQLNFLVPVLHPAAAMRNTSSHT